MEFQPFIYAPRRSYGGGMAPSGPAPRPARVAMIPRVKEVDLSIINGGDPPDPDTIYVADYFLMHPLDESFQQMWVSAFDDVAFDYLSIQLIQKQGQTELALQQPIQLRQVLIDPVIIDDCGPWASGPVFLRLATKGVVDASLYVTVYTLTNEMA